MTWKISWSDWVNWLKNPNTLKKIFLADLPDTRENRRLTIHNAQLWSAFPSFYQTGIVGTGKKKSQRINDAKQTESGSD
jgi:hypothetical protein